MTKFLLNKCTNLIAKHTSIIIGATLLITLIFSFFAVRIRIDSDFTHLLPQTFESVKAIKKLKNEFGSGHLIVAVSANDLETAKIFLKEFVNKAYQLDEVAFIEWQRPIEFFNKYQLYYLSGDDLLTVKSRLEKQLHLLDQGIHPFFQDFIGLMDDEFNPFDFSDLKKKYSGNQVFNSQDSEAYLVNPEGNIISFVIFPKSTGLDFEENRIFVGKVRQIGEDLMEQSAATIRVEYTGSLQNWIEVHDRLKNDISSVVPMVFGVLLVVIFATYRRISSIILLGLTLAVSSICTLGLTSLLLGSLNLISGFSLGMLMGLGSDFGIYMLSRYLQDSNREPNKSQLFKQSYHHILGSMTLACLTTVVAIVPLIFSNFKGFAEFGTISLLGMVSNYFAFAFFFPAMILFCEKRKYFHKEEKWLPTYQPFNFTMKRFRGSTLFVILFGVLLAWSLLDIKKTVTIEHDVQKMENYSPPLASVLLEKKLSATFGKSLRPAVLLFDSAVEKKLILEYFASKIASDREHPVLTEVLSLDSFVPQDQEQKIPVLIQIRNILAQFKKGGSYTQYLPKLPENITNITSLDLPPAILHLFSTRGQDRKDHGIILLYPAVDRNNMERIQSFASYVRNVSLPNGKTVSASGEFLVTADVYALIMEETPFILGASLVLIFFVLWVSGKNLGQAFLLIGMLFITLILMLGGMKLFDVRFNIFNIGIVPIIIGTGIDSFIHFYKRHIEDGHGNIAWTLQRMFSPIFFSSLTTIIGCGSFAFVGNEAIKTIGLVAIIGLGSVILVSLIFFPAVLQLLRRPSLKSG